MDMMPGAGITPAPGNGHPSAMTSFPLHTRATAPFEAKPFLEQAERSMGYIPPLLAQMAEAPALLEGYASLSATFRKSTLSPSEQQLVLLTVSVEHDSAYCTPAHAVRARQAALAETAIAGIRAGTPLEDDRLETLRGFTVRMVRDRGVLAPGVLEAFLAAGFTRANSLEVILAVGLKTLSNYLAQVAQTPPDPRLVADIPAVSCQVA
jgi:alkylhydroperoxidase family enzyme